MSTQDSSIKDQSYPSFLRQVKDRISAAQFVALKAVNKEIINLYWEIGHMLFLKTTEGWGKSIVEKLSHDILQEFTGINGFSARNLWRMKQFYETYKDDQKLSALLTEINWTNHLHIISKTKTKEEREYYLELCSKNNYSERELAKIIDSASYERTFIADKKLSPVVAEFPVNTKGVFKDIYLFDFLNLSTSHQEKDLRKALTSNLKQFLLELGPDFSLIGEEYIIQVGHKDFKIDLLMFHRGLNCMCAIELKTKEFHPSHLGQLQFYLEVLDTDIKKDHENPSIGILICSSKDDEVVKYALNRSMSPTMVSEYQTKMIDKAILEKKIRELSEILKVSQESD
jgi:predicted nuclease of restriction endonuclease-like (RecB) superfamily